MKHLSRLALLITFPLLLTSCGDGDEPSPEPSAELAGGSAFPVTIGSGDTAVQIESEPERIVSLSPTATEMLFAIDAGDKVVAADSFSDYPKEAPTTDLSAFEPNVEAIVSYDPDLVVAADDPGELVASLEQVGVPTVVLPPAGSLDDAYAQIEQLGAVSGNLAEAAELVASMRTEIDELIADIPDGEDVTYFHELDPNLYTITSATFLGELYQLAGMTSIADDVPAAGGGEYPQVSPEFIIRANPDVIFFADGGRGGVTAEDIAARPGWDQLTAVQEDRVVEVRPDIASRWGPRVVDYLKAVVDARAALEPAR